MNARKTAALLAGTAALLVTGPWQAVANDWALRSGRVQAQGGMVRWFSGKPQLTVAIVGQRRLASAVSVQAAALTAVVHFAGDSLVSESSSSGNDGMNGWSADRVTVLTREGRGWTGVGVDVNARYDALSNTAVIAGRRYALSRGNVFDVRVDRAGRFTVRQLPVTSFRANADTPAIIALEGHPWARKPCPPPAAAAKPDHAA